MRRSVVLILLLLLIVSPLASSQQAFGISKKIAKASVSNQIFKSYLPPAPHPRYLLVTTLDGRISLVDTWVNKVVWSFHSGEPIYSSYQAPHYHDGQEPHASELGDDFYMDCGNDWHLYNHTTRQGKCIKTERVDAREYIGKLPYSLSDRIILGRKDSAAFLLDGKTGKLIKTYRLDNFSSKPNVHNAEEKAIVLPSGAKALLGSSPAEPEYLQNLVYIERKDYKLQCISKFGDILWSVAFAEIEAEYQCQECEESLGAVSLSPETELSTSLGGNEFSLPCQTSAPVIQLRNYSYEELFSRLDGVGEPLYLRFQDDKLSLGPADDKLPLGPADDKLPLGPADGMTLALPYSGDAKVFSLPPAEIENLGITKINSTSMFAEYIAKSWVQFFVLILVFILSICGLAFHKLGRGRLSKDSSEFKALVASTKKKKPKKSGNINNSVKNEKSSKDSSHENEFGESNNLLFAEGNERKLSPTFPSLVSKLDGRRIGKLVVSNKEIAKGSNGTVVLEGVYDGRPVAVKRLVLTHHDVALKEIQNLIASDQHPNIVRWYGVEHDQDFVYLSLERCTCSLSDLVYACSASLEGQSALNNQGSNCVGDYTVRLNPLMENEKDIGLWKDNGYPSSQLLKLMRDVVSGLAHLHELGIIHRDLKPQNVLIVKERFLCAKISDMGISKRLPGDMSTLSRSATALGSSGWQAPEQLRNGRQTRAVDLFSLGCLLFFCITGGKHPYGDSYERDINILNDRKDLFLVEGIPEAVDLLSSLLDPNPDLRCKAQDVLHHPLFWASETRLSFLRDASDRVELENRETGSDLLADLESTAPISLNGKWDEKMDTLFINNIGRYRRYKYDSVRDLLRVIRNKLNHYRELPQDIQELLGSVPEGFNNYFSSRFPKLLIEVYKVFYRHCKEEEFFHKYATVSAM